MALLDTSQAMGSSDVWRPLTVTSQVSSLTHHHSRPQFPKENQKEGLKHLYSTTWAHPVTQKTNTSQCPQGALADTDQQL